MLERSVVPLRLSAASGAMGSHPGIARSAAHAPDQTAASLDSWQDIRMDTGWNTMDSTGSIAQASTSSKFGGLYARAGGRNLTHVGEQTS